VLVGGFDGCKLCVSRVFHECFAGVSRVLLRVFCEFRGCLAAVSQLFRAVSQQVRAVNVCKTPVALRYLEARRSTLQPRCMASTHGLDASTLTEHGVIVPTLSIPLDTLTLARRYSLDVGSTLGSMRPRWLDARAQVLSCIRNLRSAPSRSRACRRSLSGLCRS
jgi:hypothetical protein